jgi:hypothetical protein
MNAPVNRTLRSLITATVLALLPVVIVVGVATHELRLWWRQLRHIRALPEASSREVGNEYAV